MEPDLVQTIGLGFAEDSEPRGQGRWGMSGFGKDTAFHGATKEGFTAVDGELSAGGLELPEAEPGGAGMREPWLRRQFQGSDELVDVGMEFVPELGLGSELQPISKGSSFRSPVDWDG